MKNEKRKTGDMKQNLKHHNNAFIGILRNSDLFGFYHLRFVIYNHLFGTKSRHFIKTLSAFTILIFIIFGCSYSFTGSSVPSHLTTIGIPFCEDRSGSGEPGMADNFTTTLIDHFLSDNSLAVTDKSEADALLTCTITSISDAPTVIKGGENVSARRITIKAHVVYKDFIKKKTIFDKNFSNYGDYENTGDIISAKSAAIKAATDLITEDILLGVVSNW